MKFVTITTWEIADGTDFAVSLRGIREKRMPALRELGAEQVTLVRTSARTSAAISIWPDRETRDAAERAIEAVRRQVHTEDFTRLTGEMKGEVVAEL